MKTLTIRDETYQKLAKLKRDNESFSDVIERIIEGRQVSIEEFVGKLKNSEILKELENEWLQFRRNFKFKS